MTVSPLKVLLHDIKNPLAHIQSTTELMRLELEARDQPTGDFEQYLEILELSARRAFLLVQRVQLLSQLQAGPGQARPQPQLQAQPLHHITQETARLYRIWAQQRDVRLELCLEAVWVHADEGFLAQIVDNLLSNAIKHSDRGSRVEVQVTRSGDQGLLRIRDQGPGIPEPAREHLFEPREQSMQGSAPPQGLGLAISKQLCELMRGRIGYEPMQGRIGYEPMQGFLVTDPASQLGASFYISLPLAEH